MNKVIGFVAVLSLLVPSLAFASYVPVFTITASADSGSSISPSGVTFVSLGGSQAFSINPDGGSKISGVTVDGIPQGAVNGFTFDNVSANHAISVFSVSVGGGLPACSGPLSPLWQVGAPGGGPLCNAAFTVVAAGSSLPDGSTCQFQNGCVLPK